TMRRVARLRALSARCALPAALLSVPVCASAQGTLADYRRATAVTERLAGLTVDVAQQPTWVSPTRFWYRKSVKGGSEFVMVDATSRGARGPLGGGGGAGGRFLGAIGAETRSCVSPDGQLEAFIQNYNVALRPVRAESLGTGRLRGGAGGAPERTTPQFTMLSFDGAEGDGYQLMSIRSSPDSRHLVAYPRRPGYHRRVHYVLASAADALRPVRTYI